MILGFAYLSCAIAIIAYELFRKKEVFIDLLSVAHVFFVMGYFLQGAMINFDKAYVFDYYSSRQLPEHFVNRPIVFVVILFFYVLTLSFYHISSRAKSLIRKTKISWHFKNLDKLLIGVFGFIFFLALFLYCYSYGGYMRALALANLLRQGVAEVATFAFMKPLFHSGTLTAILIASRTKRLFSWWSLALTLMIGASIAAYALISGRANIVLLFLFVGYTLVRGKIRLLPTIIGFSIFYLIMIYGDAIFALTYYLDSTESVSDLFAKQNVGESHFFRRLVYEFQYPYASLVIALEKVSISELRFFMDYYIAAITFLPDRLTGISPPDSIAFLNTRNIAGNWNSTAPPGIISYFIYSYHYLGILIGPIIFGFIGGLINTFFTTNQHISWVVALWLYVGYEWGGFVLSGEPRVDFVAFFALNLCIVIIVIRTLLLPKIKANLS